MRDLERREVVATMVSVTALATLPAAAARAQLTPDLDELKKLVTSQRERTRLFLHMELMIYALLPYIFDQDDELKTYDDFSKSKGGQEWRGSLDAFYKWFNQFYNGAFSSALLTALDQNNADQLIAAAANVAEKLVGNVKPVFTEIGIAPEGPAGSEALRGITIVEQVNALQIGKAPDKPYLCGFFPFSYFCD